ncbi:MAG: hypothetical protein WCT31_00415 [Candidatus Micrarchaeia archaeon]
MIHAGRTDFYLQNKARLHGRPKLTISGYADHQGILVPGTFATFRKAKKAAESGKTVIARSELEIEYDGPSGLCISPVFGTKRAFDEEGTRMWDRGLLPTGVDIALLRNENEFMERAFATRLYELERYCKYAGIAIGDLKKQLRWSYWEYLEGHNRTVVADSAVPGRYHVLTSSKLLKNYTIVENGKIVHAYETGPLRPLTPELADGLPRLIETYERIRNLGHFNPNHCPIMEFQTAGGSDYFLQYHRTRDFVPCKLMDLEPGEGEKVPLFVRGSTEGERRIVRMLLYAHSYDKTPPEGFIGGTHPEEELIVRQAKLVIEYAGMNALLEVFHNMARGHSARSRLFKPEVSIAIPFEQLLSENEREALRDERIRRKRGILVDFSIISDGRTTLIRKA